MAIEPRIATPEATTVWRSHEPTANKSNVIAFTSLIPSEVALAKANKYVGSAAR
jgi:hypothetical protein